MHKVGYVSLRSYFCHSSVNIEGSKLQVLVFYLQTSTNTSVFFPSQNKIVISLREKKKSVLHRVVSLGPATKFRLHHMQCPLVQGTGENNLLEWRIQPDMMPGQYPHMPPPLPVKGLCVMGMTVIDLPRQAEKNSSIGFKMESMGGVEYSEEWVICKPVSDQSTL